MAINLQEMDIALTNARESVKTCDRSIIPTMTEISRLSQEAYNHREIDAADYSRIVERVFEINDNFYNGCMCNKKAR